MYRKEIKQGEQILSQGDNGNCAYIVESGKVHVTDQLSKSEGYWVSTGEMFGEFGVIEGAQHFSTATAEEDTLLLVVTQEEIDNKAAASDPMISLFLNFFMDRCHTLTERHYGTNKDHKSLAPRRSKIQADSDELVERFAIKEELKRALAENEFVLYFQPIISLRGGFTSGFEALVRWQHPKRGLLSPYHFIDIAEATNMIVPMGDWIFKEACRHAEIFNDIAAQNGSSEVFMSINISANQFAVPDIVERFERMAMETKVDISKIKLELTESVLMKDTEHAKKVLHRVKKLGFDLVLDDFGTGYSSLNYLHQFPIDTLKIDRSFTHSMLTDEGSLEIVRAIAGLAHNLNIDIVAEGIEEREQLSLYRDLDCQFGQGFLISKPLPAEEIYNILGTRMAI